SPRNICTYSTQTTVTTEIATTVTDNHCDDCTKMNTSPFSLSIYGTTRMPARADSNGSLEFTGAASSFDSTCLTLPLSAYQRTLRSEDRRVGKEFGPRLSALPSLQKLSQRRASAIARTRTYTNTHEAA